jgi:hypothetical protein
MKRIALLGIFVLLGSVFSSAQLFAMSHENGEHGARMSGMQNGFVHSATDFIGLPVRDAQGAQIGVLQDILLDLAENQVGYAVVMVDDASYVVPWAAITSPHANAFLQLNVDRGTLTAAPAPPAEVIDQQFGRQLHEHYGVAPYWEVDREVRDMEQPIRRGPWQDLPGAPPAQPDQPPLGGGSGRQ